MSGAGEESASPRSRIGRGVVALLKEFYGRGPEKASTYYAGDVVVVLLQGGFSIVEATLLAAGNERAVTDQRAAFQEVMRQRFTELVQEETGREVVSFMSANDQAADLAVELFVLQPKATEPTD